MLDQVSDDRPRRPGPRREPRHTVALLAALVSAGASVAAAQVSPNGGELQVNGYTTGLQSRPAVAAATDGSFVVVWDSVGSGGTDTSSYSVQGRRFSASGQPLGADFQVNTITTDYQLLPAVACDPDGGFVVAWQSQYSAGSDTFGQSIQAHRYDALGVPQGAELQVNVTTTNHQTKPAIAADGQGGFLVVWESVSSAGNDPNESVQLRRLDGGGLPAANEIQVNTYTTGFQISPDVAADAAGDAVVVWQSQGSGGDDQDNFSIQAQRYDATGGGVGGEFQVNTYTTERQIRPQVAAFPQGGFVVVWQSLGSAGSDNQSYSIQARRFDPDGAPLGGDFQVNTYTANSQSYPTVAAEAAGGFVVAWRSMGSVGNDAVTYSIQARRYDAAGTPLGAQYQVNTYTTGAQQWPAVATDGSGNFVVAWQSAGSSSTDHSSYSIQAQRFDGLYRDGFETGDTSRWTLAAP